MKLKSGLSPLGAGTRASLGATSTLCFSLCSFDPWEFKFPFHFRTTNSELILKTHTYLCLSAYGICVYKWISIFQEIDEQTPNLSKSLHHESAFHRTCKMGTHPVCNFSFLSGFPETRCHLGQSTQPQDRSEGQCFNPLYFRFCPLLRSEMYASTL